jgi:hypothetical protein
LTVTVSASGRPVRRAVESIDNACRVRVDLLGILAHRLIERNRLIEQPLEGVAVVVVIQPPVGQVLAVLLLTGYGRRMIRTSLAPPRRRARATLRFAAWPAVSMS